ncbi:MAG: hypothetical protein RLN89_15590 [Parvibaculum sp.]
MKIQRFTSVREMVDRLDPSYPIFVIWPDLIREKAQVFIEHFPGEVLYAVKCNPHPLILETLYGAGIHSFDTASLPEIARVRELLPEAACYFNHPVKGRGALDTAADVYGLEDFVIDHVTELDKIEQVVGRDVTVAVRFATSGTGAVYDLSAKFGASVEDTVSLLQDVARRGMRPALTFHVGSQCVDVSAYRKALVQAKAIIDASSVEIAHLDIGGGFPAPYAGAEVDLEGMLQEITATVKELGLTMPLLCEPGRALVADGCSLLLQVHLRKGDDLYVNEGIYGCLSEVNIGKFVMPARGFGRRHQLTGEPKAFRVFGPTCDSLDVLDCPFLVPDDIQEGDWIEVGLVGAYSLALATGFNGFMTEAVVAVEGARRWVDDVMPIVEEAALNLR